MLFQGLPQKAIYVGGVGGQLTVSFAPFLNVDVASFTFAVNANGTPLPKDAISNDDATSARCEKRTTTVTTTSGTTTVTATATPPG